MDEEPIFLWCSTCPLYTACYIGDDINYVEEDCRFGVASDYYAKEVLKDTKTEIFIY